MKYAYPIIIKYEKDDSGVDYLVTLPDFDSVTQGDSIPDAIEMGQDLLCIIAMRYEDNSTPFPKPSNLSDLIAQNPNDTVTLVTANVEEYRRVNNSKPVKKTLSIPAWLNTKAEAAGVNFSQTLQEALKQKLG